MLSVHIVRALIENLPHPIFFRSVLVCKLPVHEVEFALAELIESGYIRAIDKNCDGPFERLHAE